MFNYTKSTARVVLNTKLKKFGATVNRVATQEPVVSLTFDDGPDPDYTPQVLAVLKRFNARATFFMVGEAACQYPDVVRNVALGQHAIGNHSWNHPAFPSIGFMERWQQINKCRRALRPYGSRLFRAPYGMTRKRHNLECRFYGYRSIGWDVSCEDWCEPDSKLMADRVIENTRPGSIILLHDRLFDKGKPKLGPVCSRSPVVERDVMLSALNQILGRLTGKLQFVTVPALLQRRPAQA